jgi:uncharacterized membrane protein YphA (DoxX/SURF4 family)
MQATYPHTVRTDVAPGEVVLTTPARGAFQALKIWFIVMPIVAGIDKFTMILVDWQTYLAPVFATALPVDPLFFIYLVGVIEIGAGILVAVRPRIGGMIVGLWLLAIAFNLFLHPAGYLDIAVRDIGLAVGAFAMARLARSFAWR